MEQPGRQVPDRRRGGLFSAGLRHWRIRRGLSQWDLALAAGVSARHLSFLETGRSRPSIDMVLKLAAALDVPLRHTNALLAAAGYDAHYPDPEGDGSIPPAIRSTIDVMKNHQEPYPLVVYNTSYDVLDLNNAATAILRAIFPQISVGDDLNLAQLTLDPELGGRALANHPIVARELLWRMQRELLESPDNDRLREILDDALSGTRTPPTWRDPDPTTPSSPTLQLDVSIRGEIRSFLVVASALQAPLSVDLQEIRIEQWFPADVPTANGCRALLASAAE